MCGIAATIDLRGQGRARPWAVERLRHRGPDGDGTWCAQDGTVVLEHTRLAIIDPDNREADQPFTDATGRWVMTFNGEIFNFREIRQELEADGARFRTASDTEILLAAWARWGEAVLPRLRGMFAFVIWDRAERTLVAARDQLGVKPLYWCEEGGILALCSEVRPLMAHPDLTPALDPQGVVEYLAFGSSPGPATFIAGLRKLRPGHVLRVTSSRVEEVEYWDLLPPEASSAHTAAGEIVDRLVEAVGYALVSDVPVGLMLSGGIDSSLVAALAAQQIPPGALTCYSVSFGRPDDEAGAAGRLARDLGMRFREVVVTEQEVEAVFEDWLEDLDYPSANPTWIASWFIARAAREDGVKVLLTGDGGDEIFGGYDRWMKYVRFHDRVWDRVPAWALRTAGRAGRGRLKGLAGDIARRAASGGDLFVTSRPFHDDDLEAILGPVGREALDTGPPERAIEDARRTFDRRNPGGDYLAWMSYASTKTTLVEDYLHRLDKMGMVHSVEGRVPLLDPVLTRWAMGLPQTVKLDGGRQKALLRAAAERLLPEYILERPKQGFCAPVGGWTEALLLGGRDTLGGPLVEQGIVREDAVARLRSRGDAGFSTWTVACLGDWCQRTLSSAPALAGPR